MPKPDVPFALLLLALLAGCSTAPKAKVEDWPPQPSPGLSEAPPAPTNTPPVAVQPAPATNAPPAPRAAVRGATWVPLERWASEHNFCAPVRTAAVPPTFTVTSGQGMLVVAADHQEARWNGTEFLLGFAPRLVGGGLVLHTLDVEKNLTPLVLSPAQPMASRRVVVLDPGHGGMDSGAGSSAGGRSEKDYTLDWAKRIQPLLAAAGWTVFLTRTNDVEVSLADRVAFAEQQQADVFISLHFNSALPRQDRTGLETYVLTPTGMPSNLTRGYDDSSQVFPNNAFDAENFQYAMRLHRALVSINGSPDRGVRHARFLGALRGQNRPAVLLEGGYLSNPQEARKIADPMHRQKLAEAVARALQ